MQKAVEQSSGGSAGAGVSSGGSADSNMGGKQDSSAPVSKTAYVAAQLKQLAQAVGSLSMPPSAGGGEQGGGGGGAGGGAGSLFPPPFLLQSPSVQLQAQPQLTRSTTASSPGAAPSLNKENAPTGVPVSKSGPEEARQSLDRQPAISGGEKEPGTGRSSPLSPIDSSTVAGSAAGAVAWGPGVSAPSSASAGGSGVESEALWSQHSSVQGFLISQLEQLSQMLDSPTNTTSVAIGDSSALGLETSYASSAARGTPGGGLGARAEHGAARRGGNGNRMGSVQYSLSAVSSSSGTSSSPFSPSTAAAAAAWAAVPGRRKEGGDRGTDTGDGKVEVSAAAATAAGESERSAASSTALFSAGKFVAAPVAAVSSSSSSSSTSQGAATAAPFEGGRLVITPTPAGSAGERKGVLPVVPAPPMTPISGSGIRLSSSSGSRSSRTTGPPSLAGLRPGTTVPSTAAAREGGDVEGGKKEEDGDEEDGGDGEMRDGRKSSSSAAPALSSSSMWMPERARSGREGSAESRRRSRSSVGSRFTEAFGRAKLWRRMLEAESRGESAVMAGIVAENSGALDQGVVLPCPPSDEEKVGGVFRPHHAPRHFRLWYQPFVVRP